MISFKRLNKIITTMLIVTSLFSITACGSKTKSEREEYESLKAKYEFNLGDEKVKQTDFESDLRTFANGIFDPSSYEDMKNSVNGIKKYCTEQEYDNYMEELNFVGNSDYTINSISIYLATEDNVADIIGKKEIIEVIRTQDNNGKTLTENIMLEMYINENGMFFKHKTWSSSTLE